MSCSYGLATCKPACHSLQLRLGDLQACGPWPDRWKSAQVSSVEVLSPGALFGTMRSAVNNGKTVRSPLSTHVHVLPNALCWLADMRRMTFGWCSSGKVQM